VTALHTPGQTPGSMSLLIASGGERAILVGDAIGHPAQVEHPDWGVVDDFDGPQAEKTRRQLLDRIEAEGLVLSASHFPEPGFGHVVRLQSRRVCRHYRWPLPRQGASVSAAMSRESEPTRMISGSPNSTARGTAARIGWYAFGVTAAQGMAARYLDTSLTAAAEPL
jgi:glyoxylase-like metal-dependent hydrolase (beta-lactamase superfamily II)